MKLATEIGILEKGGVYHLPHLSMWYAEIKVNGDAAIECKGQTEELAIERRRFVLEAIAFSEGKTEELFK